MGLKSELSAAFDLMADLLEIQEGNRFRINAFRRTARALKDLAEDPAVLAEDKRLEKVPDIGKGAAQRIREYIQTGHIAELDRLLSEVPRGLPALLQVPGLGPKKVAAVWKQLGVEDLGDLKKAIASGALEETPGFGKQSAKKIVEGIQFMNKSGGRVPYGQALPLAEALSDETRTLPGVRQVVIAGSLRRGKDTIGDIDLLCTADDGAAVIDRFVHLDPVSAILAAGDTKGSVTVPLDGDREVQVDLRVVPEESFGAAWQYFSGSKEHNVRLREMAVRQGYKLNEWGLFQGDRRLAGREEGEIYEKLGLPLIPPEVREDRGEFECDAAAFEELVTLQDIRGDLHTHTVASDGRSTLEEMARAAKAAGYEYLNISDHSKSSVIANGLSVERMEQQIEQVRALDTKFKGLRILVGCECDILSNGALDYPDDILAACDVVVASIHTAIGQDRQTITRRTIQAMEHPHVHIVGHPTSRMLGKRPASALDIAAVVQAAVDTGTALEINASWKRLDLQDVHVRQAMEGGALLSINTDSHHVDQLAQMRYGVSTARRGWATRERVLNTFGLKRLLSWTQNKKA